MRHYQVGLFALTAALTACHAEICDLANCYAAGGSGASGGQGGNPTTGGNGGEGGNVIPTECDPSQLGAGQSIADTCGVFVSKSGSGMGTQASPAPDVTTAISKLSSSTAIYICGSDTFQGSLALPPGVSVFGGLDCAWQRDAAQVPTIAGDADVAAVTIVGAGTSRIEDVAVTAPDAVADGASSIGVIVETATVSFARVAITAGAGADGAPGDDQAQTNNLAGPPGNPGNAPVCDMNPNPGGSAVTNTCANGMSVGNTGGGGTPSAGIDGVDGTPIDGSTGKGGNNDVSCAAGGTGGFGKDGDGGPVGLGAQGKGVLDASGYAGEPGGVGEMGPPGQGGGGGGGKKGNDVTDCSASNGVQLTSGPSGGSGGAGGCGGAGAGGGEGGGSSFGLVSLNASIVLDQVTITGGSGGAGGKGGKGQPGASGGAGGALASGGAFGDGCSGGQGGRGGNGGGGGGGRGGHSSAIVFVGSAPTEMGTLDFSHGVFGLGGVGEGNGTDAGSSGGDGSACDHLDFNGVTEICSD